uniref:CCHC-type domain-containing protein n=1 Tax=Tanacetum cinerariifolium TaxID=118510 RepID=A0A6L2KFA3_TANCI|nr:hypothetical protein [Tanacetum cinerariifolium]
MCSSYNFRENKRQGENELTSDGETYFVSDNLYIKRHDLDCDLGSFKVNVTTSSQDADVHLEQEHCKNSFFSFDARTENVESSSAQEVIINGDSVSSIASASAEGSILLKTVEEKLARKNELKEKSTLMLAILDEHLLKFHACKDENSLWEAIKNRFEGNKESKKIQKNILKQNYENFAASSQERLDKTYDRFQKLISQLEIHGEVISQEDANMKLLRSLPPAWDNIALIMRNKTDLDTLSMDDLYNNIKVYEFETKSQSNSSSNSQNVAFVSLDNSSNTNETVNTAHSISTASSKDQASTASYADDVMFSFFSNQFNAPQLDNEDLEHIDTDDLEEMNLKWQVAMLTIRVKRFTKKIGRKLDLNGKETVGFDRTKVECYKCYRRCHFARECRAPMNQGNRNRDALTRNTPVDTSTTNALVVQDRIGGYDWSFQDEEELINFSLMAYTSQGSLSSSNSDSEISLGYDGHVNESEVFNNVVNSCESDRDDNQVNDRFKKGEGYHAVPPPYTGNYIPSRADLSFTGLDNSVFKSKDSLEKPKTVRSSIPIIEDWESDSEDKNVVESKEVKKTVKPSLEKIEFANARNTTVEKNKAKKPRKFRQSPRVPVNTVKQSYHRAATSVSAARHVNTAASRPNINNALPTTYSYFKAHSPVRRPFNKKSAAKTNNFNKKVNTAKVNNVTTTGPKAVVSAAEGNKNNAVKSSACWI